MTTEWWGITILCVVCVLVWILLSALLYRLFFKRFYDIILSLSAIIVFSPFLLVLTVVGAIAMKGNPFFVQRRPGRRKKLSKRQCIKRGVPYGSYGEEKIIKLLKFRTMTNAKDENGNLLPDERRLNGYGKFLRSTSLDEIPSLFNIFIGNISVVGPRPLLVKYLPLYSEKERHRHDVRPGLTGLAQVNGRNAISWEEKFKYDLEYVSNITLWRDIMILFKTVGKVLKHSGISQEGQATMEDFKGTKNICTKKTPYYVISQKILDENIEVFKKALKDLWPNSVLSYSVKTNSLPWLLKYLKEKGLSAEVVSDEEYLLSEKCGFDKTQIIFNGPIKGEELFKKAISGHSILNIDSEEELEYLKKYHGEKDILGIRINVNPDYFSVEDTSFKEDGFRFGFSDEGGGLQRALNTVYEIYGKRDIGLHVHCNSATRSIDVYKSISKYVVHIIKKYNLEVSYVDIGGGFFGGVEGKPNAFDYIDIIKNELEKNIDINKTKLIVEPGSAIIGSAVDLYTSVLDVKDTVCSRLVTTDGSRLHLDPLWKKNNYKYSLNVAKENIHEKQIVCGYTCMDYDRIMVLHGERELSNGDEVIYHRVGSYTMTFGGMFIRYLPPVYVDDGQSMVKVRSRITVDDYYKLQS